MPVAVTTGSNDPLVPPDSTLRLLAALKTQGTPALSIHQPNGDMRQTMPIRLLHSSLCLLSSMRKNASAAPVLRALDKETTIVCLGDSVTGVYYHTGGHRAYPEMLELAFRQIQPDAPMRVINAGISGQTTTDGLAR